MIKRHFLLGLIVFVVLTVLVMIPITKDYYTFNFAFMIRGNFSRFLSKFGMDSDILWQPTNSSSTQSAASVPASMMFSSERTRAESSSGENSIRANASTKLTTAAPEKKSVNSTTNRPLLCQSCFTPHFASLLPEPPICAPSGGTEPEMVMMITSSLDGSQRRQAIRDTWVSVTQNNRALVRHFFILGTSKQQNVSEDLKREAERYKDLLVFDFVDSYGNLTLKTIAGLTWMVRNCGKLKFFLKTDQDMFVFVNRILALARKHENTLKTSLGGACYQNAEPWRDPRTRYYASFQSYPQRTYPGFCSGTGYVSTLDLAKKVVDTSPNIPFFHLEDVYLALVLRHVGYKLTWYEGFVQGSGVCNNPSSAQKAMTIHEVDPQTMRTFWDEKCGV